MSRLHSSSGPDGDAGPAKLYIGHVSSRANTRDLEDMFAKYGRVLNVEVKPAGYGFVEYDDPRDAQDAMHALNGYIFEGQRLVVEFSRRAGNATSNCFICGQVGHWVRECPENVDKGLDVRSGKCFKCGEVGHLAKFCRGGSGRGRSRSPPAHYRSRSPGPSRRRSPSPRGGYRDRDRHSSRRLPDPSPPSRYRDDRSPPPPRRYDQSPPRRDYGRDRNGRDRDGYNSRHRAASPRSHRY
ncbi:uncharacterized protein SPPG_02888 [Spizellomyces punctatus DAOM BR117]|uniref:Uncharacterized protein n=1 Tax=Spizellomyces punctatus (strain DAOM BR117) TaxID=645134 RepID=A0A0L0HMV0_SPIPD|nr:uncharacterized protein SPPG_02888 [Spizellomyces punctatus DAOM BR117]KND02422.1 hypothetical protein SPPG_02888 [Spizellomyces punctatus DAOM BR117]|eukprot:XP_016610461.1 hypothetical protein SPPG_02888 [Spizellomyces punctatus DAOM BR117]